MTVFIIVTDGRCCDKTDGIIIQGVFSSLKDAKNSIISRGLKHVWIEEWDSGWIQWPIHHKIEEK